MKLNVEFTEQTTSFDVGLDLSYKPIIIEGGSGYQIVSTDNGDGTQSLSIYDSEEN